MNAPRLMGSPIGARMRVNGKLVNYFCGTSYYSLHSHPEVIAAACNAAEAYGLGVATLAGVPVYDEVKRLARTFFDVEAITYFATGYLSISVLLQGLRNDYDTIFVDAASHYSVYDAIRALGKETIKFSHLDSGDMAAKLSAHASKARRPVIVTDGVFPSTGAIAPLDEYAEVMKLYPDAILCIDDSHAVGVLGPNGRGTFDHFGLRGPQFCLAGTLSKAFGGFGGFVAGSAGLAEKIKEHAKLMVGASAPPIPAAAAACEGLRLLGTQPEFRQALWQNVRQLRGALAGIGINTPDTNVPIVSFSATADLEDVSRELEHRDILVRYVAPRGYSDAPDIETLRIAVFSTHSPQQIDHLVDNLRELL
jgi:8-amino-7-oxononanoate synthase